ncbi:PGN_0703 family putative restriction endonuclease [Desulfonatronovibrio magnus]|uniref:PGN_0703 family putative restriction endonuclease n=1 Tax=Desulfonatronovibrio magnus TaxID=698827 RepID=UPI0005EBD720|nr:hypothetical protein [Desulfonatronovibrio magnus]
MDISQSYNEWVNSVLASKDLESAVSSFINLMDEKYEELSRSGFLFKHSTKGGIFSPENRNYEIDSKTGCLAGYKPGLNTEPRYSRDIFNNKTIMVLESANKPSCIHLFAYEAPLLRLETERDVRFRISADMVGVNDKDEIIIIETKLPGGDSMDKAILQSFGYAYFLSKHLASGNHSLVIDHARECLKKFHVQKNMAKKIKEGKKIKYMVIAPSAYFIESIHDSAILHSTEEILRELNRHSSNQKGYPEFAGYTFIENIFPYFKDISEMKNFINAFSFLSRPKTFSEDEKNYQVALKKKGSPIFSVEAQKNGEFKKYIVDYCLPISCKDENIFKEIRKKAYNYFSDKNIKWHSLGENHLLSSQAYCVNFFFPFRKNAEALKVLLLPYFPDIKKMLPIEDQLYVAFEWNGGKNYLDEKGFSKKNRGEYATYPDVAVRYITKDDVEKLILIEWKYTETYPSSNKTEGKSGIARLNTYSPFLQKNDCPIDLKRIDADLNDAIESIFYEPFYQLMREQLLAKEIEQDNDNPIQKVTVLHICPKANQAYHRKITSPKFAALFPDKSVTEIWRDVLQSPDDFISIDPKDLFQNFLSKPESKDFSNWIEYMKTRYRLS